MKNRQNVVFIILFLLIISLPESLWLLKLDIKTDIVENRALAVSPSYKKDISAFNKQLDQYINDNMHLRKYIISWYHYFWGWYLYSPVSSYYIRGKDNQAFGFTPLKSAAMRKDNPDIAYNEIAHGMYYLSRYYNSDFIYVLLPDKESAMMSYIPHWAQRFKEKHNILSLRELFLSQVKEPMFTFIDLYEYMNADEKGVETYFDKRIDVYHCNGKGVDLAVQLICEAINANQSSYICDEMKLNVEKRRYTGFPYHTYTNYEDVLEVSMEGDMSSMESIPYGEVTDWTGVDYIKNHKVKSNSILVLSDSSLKSSIELKTNKLELRNRILPFVFESASYMHTHHSIYMDYDFFINAIHEVKPEYIVFAITERALNERSKKYLRDPVFRILGRYALGMNENFIFPEDLSISYLPETSEDSNFSVYNTSPFPIHINKDLKTDVNGDIYVSLRYSSTKNANKAVLEWTSDKEFKTDIKRSSVKISGGGIQTISFHIKDLPNRTIYARITPGTALGKYEFYEIKELRNPVNISNNK